MSVSTYISVVWATVHCINVFVDTAVEWMIASAKKAAFEGYFFLLFSVEDCCPSTRKGLYMEISSPATCCGHLTLAAWSWSTLGWLSTLMTRYACHWYSHCICRQHSTVPELDRSAHVLHHLVPCRLWDKSRVLVTELQRSTNGTK